MHVLIPLLLAPLCLDTPPAGKPTFGPPAPPSTDAQRVEEPAYLEGQVIVRFDAPTTILAAVEQLAQLPVVVDELLTPQLDLFLVLLPEELGVPEAIDLLEKTPGVRYAVPDHFVALRDTTPNDPKFGQQWPHQNTGQTGGVVDADIDAPAAWDLGTGSTDYVIAIVDGGGQHDHVDLVTNRWRNAAELTGSNGVDDDGNGYVDDKYGWNAYNNNGNIPSDSHGTHVAGIAGASGDNGIGVAGVNWTTNLMYVAGASGNTSTVLKAYTYVLTQRQLFISSGGTQGANVVSANSSFGIDYANCNSPSYQPWNDMYNTMGAAGILNAAATINANQNVDSIGDVPTGCSSDWLITVTNTDKNDNKSYAGYGATTIDLGAPGESVLSTVPNNNYTWYSGTSMATPHVTGAVAFLHSVASPAFQSFFQTTPDLAALTLKEILLQNVDVIPSMNGKTVSDGRLNLEQAALAISQWTGSCATATYCQTSPNSAGPGAVISSLGSTSYTARDFTLKVDQAVPGSMGLFFYGTGETLTPIGDGFLCVAGATARLNPAPPSCDSTTPPSSPCPPHSSPSAPCDSWRSFRCSPWPARSRTSARPGSRTCRSASAPPSGP